MSVTFSTESSPILGYRIICVACGAGGPAFQTHKAALEWLRDKMASVAEFTLRSCTGDWCEMDSLFIDAIEEDPAPAPNFANANAVHILQTLGLAPTPLNPETQDEIWCGEVEADDFHGRVLMAIAVAPRDDGVPPHEVLGSAAHVIDCGRRPGYTQEALTALRELAEFASDRGRNIIWA